MGEKTKNNSYFKEHQDVIIPIIITISIILLAVILFLVRDKMSGDMNSNEQNETTAVTEKGVIKDEEFQGLKFTNATLINKDGIYTLSVDVKNTSKEASKVTSVNIPIKDKNGHEIITLLGYIGKVLKPGETTTIVASTSADLSKAYTKEITEKK